MQPKCLSALQRPALTFLFCLSIAVSSIGSPVVAQRANQSLTLAAPIGNHMVLQQGKPTSVWGKAKANEKVTVAFGGQSIDAQADANGDWRCMLEPLTTSATPADMAITAASNESISVTDVLVGEVWMCSGQSNMAWTLKRSQDPKVEDADLPLVRIFKTGSATAETPQTDCKGSWAVVTPETAGGFSAVGYFFGRELHEKLKVPIGLVDTSWGGKPVEAFVSTKKLTTVPQAIPLLEEWNQRDAQYNAELAEEKHQAALAKWKTNCEKITAEAKQGAKTNLPRRPWKQKQPRLEPNFPSTIFNQKVSPWTRYAIAGSIWYQGEANRDRADQYTSLLTALIEDWRALWNDDFPFYIVQLANFTKPTTTPGVPNAWAELQNSQTLVAQTVPNCGIAIANDIGAGNDIHPKNKRDVGHRLALLALKKHYNQDIEVFSSPLYAGHTVAGDHVVIKFAHVGTGLKSRDGGELQRFEIAGEDQVWHWAKAEIQSADTVKVSSELVAAPVAVRYAWAANPEGANLVNSAGLPASLLRTDDWPLSTDGRFTHARPKKAK